MAKGKLMLRATGIAAAAFLLSSCNGAPVELKDDPDWKTSLSQSNEVSAETIATLDKTAPQIETDRFSASLVPLGQETVDGQKVTKVALSANLPVNCADLTVDDISDACLTFVYAAATERVEQEGKDYTLPRNSDIQPIPLETREGVSIIEISSPADTEKVMVTLGTEGAFTMIDAVSGEIVNSDQLPSS